MNPIRFPLATDLQSRTNSTAKDAKIVNGYVEVVGDKHYVLKRPGTVVVHTPAAPIAGNGMTTLGDILYAVFGSSFYEITYAGNAVLRGTANVFGGISSVAGIAVAHFTAGNITTSTSSGKMYFSPTATMPYLFMHNLIHGWTFNASTLAVNPITNLNFPTLQTPARVLVPGTVYTNNTTFVMTRDGRIYNSAIEDPTSWNALDYITMTSEPSLAVAIARTVNYVVAFGSNFTEFFYYAGNPTGSPLAVNLSAKLEMGCANANSIVNLPSALAFIGNTKQAGRSVYIMTNLQPKKVSTKAVEAYLNGDPMTNVRGFTLGISGHTFYGLTLPDSNVTLMYDLETGLWQTWSSFTNGVEQYYELSEFVPIGSTSYSQNPTTGYIVKVDLALHTDEGTAIPFRIVTPRFEGTTNNLKFFQSMEIIADKVVGTLSVRYTDDDYTTWSQYRTVNLNEDRPVLRQLGSSRRRAYEYYDAENKPLRILGTDVLLREGLF